ncbi:MAG TPA: SRPBCC family protein [Pilimelia sp.]|nr:SRPBCC family protein [Pilimelia sp.]
MRLDYSFTVPVPVEEAWQVLLDLPRVAPCMPGATLTGVDGDEFTGTVKVKLGPISLTYQGKGRFVERDEAARRVVIEASGKDARSAGTASATVTTALVGEGDITKVDVNTDLTVTGRPAQFGRGMIVDVGGKLIGQFADCLARTLAGDSAAGTGAPAASADAPAGAPATSARPSGAGPAPRGERGGPGTATAAERPVPQEAEPIDLLRITGGTPAARRLAAYGVGALLLALVAALTIRRLRRARGG